MTPEVILVNAASTQDRQPSTFPNLGLLTLGTMLRNALRQRASHGRVLYFDGALLGDEVLQEHIARRADNIALIAFSAYTNSYAGCVELAKIAKARNPRIVTVIGNDHFSALWQQVMTRRPDVFDYGFHGNDVVEGFARLALDVLAGEVGDLAGYPGLVYRDSSGTVRRNPEDPDEFARLPLVDYSLLDSMLPHADRYHGEQLASYDYMRDCGYRSTVVEIARGCLKFAGPRNADGVPFNACDFCGIIPGTVAIAAASAARAWAIIHNAWSQGYNYLYVTADEFPLTFWPLIRAMTERPPAWFVELAPSRRPRLMCYARADAFRENMSARIDVIMQQLGVDHFFVGLDGLSSISLRAMNKGINPAKNLTSDLWLDNLQACSEIARRGGRLTAGIILTHLGATRRMMEEHFDVLKWVLSRYSHLFAAIGCELFVPVPGSLSFGYLRTPGVASTRARALGVVVNEDYLGTLQTKYADEDVIDCEELIRDFIKGCCPDVTVDFVYDQLRRTRALIEQHRILCEGKLAD